MLQDLNSILIEGVVRTFPHRDTEGPLSFKIDNSKIKPRSKSGKGGPLVVVDISRLPAHKRQSFARGQRVRVVGCLKASTRGTISVVAEHVEVCHRQVKAIA